MSRYLIFPIMLFLTACANPFTGEKVTPETPNQRLLVLEYSYQGALKTVDQLITNGIINSSNAEKVQQLVSQADNAVKAARSSVNTGGTDAIQAINIANSLVLQLITYLQTQQPETTSWRTYYLPPKVFQRFSPPSPMEQKQQLASLRQSVLPRLKAVTSPMMN